MKNSKFYRLDEYGNIVPYATLFKLIHVVQAALFTTSTAFSILQNLQCIEAYCIHVAYNCKLQHIIAETLILLIEDFNLLLQVCHLHE